MFSLYLGELVVTRFIILDHQQELFLNVDPRSLSENYNRKEKRVILRQAPKQHERIPFTEKTKMIIYSLPLVGALIGWFTNYLAVKMLFHPRDEKKILFLRIQGVFPKRQQALAHKVGMLVSSELISTGEIIEHLKEKASSEAALDHLAWGGPQKILGGDCDLGCPPLFGEPGKVPPGAVFLMLEKSPAREISSYGKLCLDPNDRVIYNGSEIKNITTLVQKCLTGSRCA